MSKEVVYRKISELKKLPNNPRTIKKDDMERLKKSIKDNPDYFEARPIILSNRTGDLVILAGNQRYEAAKALGMDEVPTFLLEGLTEAREREIIIRDNVSNGEWDFDILANEFDINDLESWGVDTPAPKLYEDGALGKEFIVPPFTVLDTRTTAWLNRKRAWQTVIQASEKGRGENLLGFSGSKVMPSAGGYTSIFDPVLCEIIYRWFNVEGGSILDPFAGGSVRGIVAGTMGMQYFGNDLSAKQIDEDEKQAKSAKDIIGEQFVMPEYNIGDSCLIDKFVKDKSSNKTFDLVMSCPPYADLERYSDDPGDLSNMDYNEFIDKYRSIIKKSVAMLKPNRFAVFVVGEIRDKSGEYRNFVGDTVKAFNDAGLRYYNHAILVNRNGSAGVRAKKQMANKKLVHTHQDVIVGVKDGTGGGFING